MKELSFILTIPAKNQSEMSEQTILSDFDSQWKSLYWKNHKDTVTSWG